MLNLLMRCMIDQLVQIDLNILVFGFGF